MSAYTVELDRVSEAEWSEILDRFADANIYQTWAYGAIRWGARNLSHLVLKRGGEVVGAAQLRIVRPASMPMGIAYLRWGPLCQVRGSELNPEIFAAMASALREEYCKKKGLYLEILPNAFGGSKRADAFQTSFQGYDSGNAISSEDYRTLLVDLEPSLEDVRKKLDKKWRNQLNASERNNLTIVTGTTANEYSAFSELYSQMWERKKFKSTVSVEEFGRIQEGLPENQRMKIVLCVQEGQPVAGVVCSAMGDSGIYLLGATNEAGMKSKAAYLIHWTVIRSLKEQGIRYYDLGGIDPEANPGVYHFKSGFSGADVSHIQPLSTCDSMVSLALVKTGNALRDGWRNFRSKHAAQAPQTSTDSVQEGRASVEPQTATKD
jgi:lipid II:glycine glycyltransferase (peptidoglycan interpeptide bridge formation enzyme)